MNQQVSEWRRFLYWIPAILLAIVISLFSTHYFSSEQTARVIIPVLHWLLPGASPHLLRLMHVGIRKMAHVTEFGLFSIAVFRGIRGGRFGWRFSWALATLAIAVAYAGLDEWHQSFVPLRQARVRDVAIDAFGAVLAQVLVWFYAKFRTNRATSPELSGDTSD
ncbi:MAG: VanZ family protein [Candidatus Acidiferrum sp.]